MEGSSLSEGTSSTSQTLALQKELLDTQRLARRLMVEVTRLRSENASLKQARHQQESRNVQLGAELQTALHPQHQSASSRMSISPSLSESSSDTGHSNKENSPPSHHGLIHSSQLHAQLTNMSRVKGSMPQIQFRMPGYPSQTHATNILQPTSIQPKAVPFSANTTAKTNTTTGSHPPSTSTLGKRVKRDHDENTSPAKRLRTESESTRPKLSKSQNRRFEQIRTEILALSTPLKQSEDVARRLEEVDPDDWQYRIFLMEMIEYLAETNNDFDVSVLMSLRLTIKAQLTDLRSQIVRHACDMLVVVSKAMGKKFVDCLVYLLPTHLTGVAISIEVMRQSHDHALTQCIINSRSLKIMHNLLRFVSDKRPEVKIKVISLITQLLTMCCQNDSRPQAKKNLRRYIDGICDTIKSCIGDANPTVRQRTRELFLQFAAGFPKQSAVLLSKLDYSAQKALRKAQEKQAQGTAN